MSPIYALQQILFTVVLPVVVSGGLYFLLRRAVPSLALVLAIVAGYIGGHLALRGLPPFPPSNLFHYFPYFALIALAWLGLERLWSKNFIALWGLRSLVLLALYFYLLRRIIQNTWEVWETIVWFAGILLVLLVVWRVLEELSQREPPRLSPALFLTAVVILIVGSSVTAATSGSVVLGQLGGVLAASVGIIMALSWFMKVKGTHYLPTVFVFLQGSMWLGGAIFSELPIISGVILALSPLLLLLIKTPRTLRNDLLRLVVFVLPILAVAGFSLVQFLQEPPF